MYILYMYTYTHIYIYIEREREREILDFRRHHDPRLDADVPHGPPHPGVGREDGAQATKVQLQSNNNNYANSNKRRLDIQSNES